MRYSVCFPFPLIFSHAALSNRYCKFFCFDFILAISGSIPENAISESIHNSLITSFSRPASEPELSESESFRFSTVTFSSKLFSDASTSYSTWKGTERLFCSCDMAMRMTTTNWVSQEIRIIYIILIHYIPSMNEWVAPRQRWVVCIGSSIVLCTILRWSCKRHCQNFFVNWLEEFRYQVPGRFSYLFLLPSPCRKQNEKDVLFLPTCSTRWIHQKMISIK